MTRRTFDSRSLQVPRCEKKSRARRPSGPSNALPGDDQARAFFFFRTVKDENEARCIDPKLGSHAAVALKAARKKRNDAGITRSIRADVQRVHSAGLRGGRGAGGPGGAGGQGGRDRQVHWCDICHRVQRQCRKITRSARLTSEQKGLRLR